MKASILNVKKHLERCSRTLEDMLTRDNKHPSGLRLAPIDRDELRSIKFITDAILRKHAVLKTRKDIRFL